jgi:hypothetical protein
VRRTELGLPTPSAFTQSDYSTFRTAIATVPLPKNPLFFAPSQERSAFAAFISDNSQRTYSIGKIVSESETSCEIIPYVLTSTGSYLVTNQETQQIPKSLILCCGALLKKNGALNKIAERKITKKLQERQ